MSHIQSRISVLLAALALTLATGPALANCPPGLAKKNPPCIPPGLARKATPTEDHDHTWHSGYWETGTVLLPDQITHYIRYPDRYSLPPLGPGERYVVVGNQILKVDAQTYTVVSVLQAIDGLLD